MRSTLREHHVGKHQSVKFKFKVLALRCGGEEEHLHAHDLNLADRRPKKMFEN